jgi:hypothetical protein
MSIDYHAWLEHARAELAELQAQKDAIRAQREQLARQEQDIDKKINGVAQAVSGLASLVPDVPQEVSLMSILGMVGKAFVEVGITARIRAILQAAAPRSLSAVELRDELTKSGFYTGDYSNALATIYTTLKRMAGAGEVIESGPGIEPKRFQWAPKTFLGAPVGVGLMGSLPAATPTSSVSRRHYRKRPLPSRNRITPPANESAPQATTEENKTPDKDAQ